MPGSEPTVEEREVIRDLRALAKRWPRTLSLISASGSLVVVHTADRGSGALCGDRMADVSGIPNDGGDPDYYDAADGEAVWDL